MMKTSWANFKQIRTAEEEGPFLKLNINLQLTCGGERRRKKTTLLCPEQYGFTFLFCLCLTVILAT